MEKPSFSLDYYGPEWSAWHALVAQWKAKLWTGCHLRVIHWLIERDVTDISALTAVERPCWMGDKTWARLFTHFGLTPPPEPIGPVPGVDQAVAYLTKRGWKVIPPDDDPYYGRKN
jgi:hypothetical protein